MRTSIVAFAILTFTAAGIVACTTAGPVEESTEPTPVAELTPMEELGKALFFDGISEPGNMSCSTCHLPDVGFTGPLPAINLHGSVYAGAIPERFGNRKPPTAAYATWSPVFHFDETEGLFIGGNFWDGRATGETLGNPAAEQALGPFLNPVEQNVAGKLEVLQHVAAANYAGLWEEVWGAPIGHDTAANVETNYDRVGLAIGAYEASFEVNPFSSKFDVFWDNLNEAGLDVRDIDMSNWTEYEEHGLSSEEVQGLALFNDVEKGMCAECHVLEPAIDADGREWPPLFTDFSFDNLGTPKNPELPFYGMDTVLLEDGTPVNPEGAAWVDPGLGGFLETRPEWQAMAAENYGKHKVPTLRNVARWPGVDDPTADMPKAFMHNGVFKSLKEVVNFYNRRDVDEWPPPEVPENVNVEELGDLGLSDMEEMLIVIFMGTLSDGYTPPRTPIR